MDVVRSSSQRRLHSSVGEYMLWGMTLEAIKQAITELPEQERTSLVAWLNEEDARAWDKQIEDDFSESGAGMALLETWDAEIKTGRSVPLEEFLAKRDAADKAK